MSSRKLPKLAMNGTFVERLAHLPRLRRAEHRVRVVEQQHLRGRQRRGCELAALRTSRLRRCLRREEDAARLADAAEQRVERVDGERVNSPLVCASGAPPMIATAGRSSASSRASRSMRFAGDAGDLLDLRRRVVGEAGRPAVDQRRRRARRVGRPQLVARGSRAPGRARARLRCPACTGTHSSALAPVCDIRDSTCTNLPRTPGRPCRIAP